MDALPQGYISTDNAQHASDAEDDETESLIWRSPTAPKSTTTSLGPEK